MASAPQPFVSGIAKLDGKKHRLTLLAEVARSAGWVDLKDGETLVAEFVAPGHYRLHRREAGKAAAVAAQARARYAVSPDLNEAAAQTAADQFRPVTFYKSDNNRIWVKAEVVMGLVGSPPYPKAMYLYLQAGIKTIDVMTHEVRLARLAEAVGEE